MLQKINFFVLTTSLFIGSLIHMSAPLKIKASAHKFYVSTSNVTYNSNTASLEIIQRVFTDDLESVLRMRYGQNIKLALDNEPKENAELIKRYITSQWRIVSQDKELSLNYLGHTYDIDQVKIFIEVPVKSRPKTLFFENKTLFDLTSDQQNIIHVKVGDQRRSLLLFSENPNGVLNFK